jgi:hypothetical protein
MASKNKKTEQKESGSAELIRRFKERPLLFGGTVVILIIVIVAFVFVPAMTGPGTDGEGSLTFGYYKGVPINYVPDNYFGRSLMEAEQMLRYGVGNEYSMWETAFFRTMMHIAILEEMRIAGYSPPTEEINKKVAALPDFQEDGRFSIVKYRRYDKNRLSTLWRTEEEDYIQEQYTKNINKLRVSSLEKNFMENMGSPTRSFDMAVFPRSDFPDAEVAIFAASNPAPFKMVHLSRVTVTSSEREAQQLLESVQSGRSVFEDTARNQSQDFYKEQGGDMGIKMAWEIYRDIPDTAERESVVSLSRGAYSGVVKVPHPSDSEAEGWAFFRAEEEPRPSDLSAVDIAEKARSYMRQFEGGRIENWLVARAGEFIAQARESSFAETAASREMELKHFGPVNLNYGNVNLFTTLDTEGLPELTSAVSNENFWKTAFATPLNTPSVPFTLGENVVILIPVEENTEDSFNRGILDWYAGSWISYVMDREIRDAFSASEKFEDKSAATIFEILLSSQLNQF